MSGAADNTIRIWSLASGAQLWQFFGPAQMSKVEVIANDFIAAGDSVGKLLLLKVQGLDTGTYKLVLTFL